MTVRREIAEPCRETGARSPEAPMRTRAVRRGSEGRARWSKACRSSGSTIAAEAFIIMGANTPPLRHRSSPPLAGSRFPAQPRISHGSYKINPDKVCPTKVRGANDINDPAWSVRCPSRSTSHRQDLPLSLAWEGGMEPDDLLCSRNARSRTPLVGCAQ
jgi:hypothetical protein